MNEYILNTRKFDPVIEDIDYSDDPRLMRYKVKTTKNGRVAYRHFETMTQVFLYIEETYKSGGIYEDVKWI